MRIPKVNTKPKLEVRSGVNALPRARTNTPATSTRAGPKRSANAPATGCTAPQTNCPTAIAKLMVTMPTPVDPAIGKRNNPWVCRRPIVTINIAAAAMERNSHEFVLSLCVIMSLIDFSCRLVKYKGTHQLSIRITPALVPAARLDLAGRLLSRMRPALFVDVIRKVRFRRKADREVILNDNFKHRNGLGRRLTSDALTIVPDTSSFSFRCFQSSPHVGDHRFFAVQQNLSGRQHADSSYSCTRRTCSFGAAPKRPDQCDCPLQNSIQNQIQIQISATTLPIIVPAFSSSRVRLTSASGRVSMGIGLMLPARAKATTCFSSATQPRCEP